MKNLTVVIQSHRRKGHRFVADGGDVMGAWVETRMEAIEGALHYEDNKHYIYRGDGTNESGLKEE